VIPPGALAGLKVLELGELTAAPYAAKLFGDYGADVVKVESPGRGDPTRRRGPFPEGRPDPERSGLFLYLNTNKRSVTLDLDQGAARPIMSRLLDWADILITNCSAAQLSRWGLCVETLRARHSTLIITTITPFGMDGPYAEYRGDELVTYAMGGLAYSTPGMPDAAADAEREPPLHPGCSIAETVTGMTAAAATMVAVFGRHLSQCGCHVDIGQQAVIAAMQQRDVSMASYSGVAFDRLLNPRVIGRMPNFYLPCKDGYVVIAAFLDHQWHRLVDAMGNPEWAQSDAFRHAAGRTANWIELRLRLIDWTMTHSGDELSALGAKLQLPLFPFYPIRKLAESNHVRHRNSLVDIAQGETSFRMPGPPISMLGTPWTLRRPAPRLGEHTYEILHEGLGLSASNIQHLFALAAV
jgi:crotonobetainyl-CoA:carnitine CoA-transferase CaiB-like acyl-CoA transferase